MSIIREVRLTRALKLLKVLISTILLFLQYKFKNIVKLYFKNKIKYTKGQF